jgi:signal transduction histidine kinase
MSADQSFPRLVSLACHDMRTPLATVYGFARTLVRMEGLEEPAGRYVSMIESAAGQLAELIDELALATRIEAGRYAPTVEEVDTGELARVVVERLGAERVRVAGTGAPARVDPKSTGRAVSALAQCALRHGGLDEVRLTVSGTELTIAPITPASAPVVLGEDLRDLGAATAVRLVEALGGSLALDGETLRVRLPS